MAIIASYGQDDARGAAWLLATTARDCLQNPNMAPNWQDALNNAYRLLESYRVNGFFGTSRVSGDRTVGSLASLAVAPETENHLPDVVIALDETMEAVFSGRGRDQALDLIENSLRSVAYPDVDDAVLPEERATAARFFDVFVQKLHYA